jgi:hypothetical protein
MDLDNNGFVEVGAWELKVRNKERDGHPLWRTLTTLWNGRV